MNRQHVHLAQGVPADRVISGMRKSSQILIFIDLERAMRAGIKFFLADNGVILTKGNEHGFVPTEFFSRVEDAQQQPMKGWKQSASVEPDNTSENQGDELAKVIEQVSLTDEPAPRIDERAPSAGSANEVKMP